MKNRIIYILVAIVLSGCASPRFVQTVPVQTDIPTSEANNTTIIKDMMTRSGCINACWLGIEPGITDPAVVEGILKNYYGQENVSISQNDSDGWRVVGWKSISSQLSPYSGGVVIKDNNISRIEVYFESLATGDVIAAIGAPEVVLVAPDSTIDTCYGIWGLLYSSTGLELELGHNGLLEETARVFKMVIWKPLSQDNQRAQELPNSYRMLPWKGYVDYCSLVQLTKQP